MHIDLNSCFATIEQQAHPSFRGKPLVVAAYASPGGCVLSPSMEARKLGIKTGMRVREARLFCRDIIVRTPDPPLVRDVHVKFNQIFRDYSDIVIPKSIDEAILDLSDLAYCKKDLVTIGKEIKQRMRSEIGEWISCSVGIGTNRFLAKTAASLKKPDGLETINHENLKDIYAHLQLTDLCGISNKYQARLNIYKIFTPLEFLAAPEEVLTRQVFRSIVGYYWYLRLRGWEIDAVEFGRKSFGQDYALTKPTSDPQELSPILMKLCEKMGRRLRRHNMAAKGIHIALLYSDGTHWHRGRTVNEMYATIELYKKAQYVFNQQPEIKTVSKLAVSCYGLTPNISAQATLFDQNPDKLRSVSKALDAINDKYSEYTITPAVMLGMDKTVLDRIAFGKLDG